MKNSSPEAIIKYTFQEPSLLTRALTHSSYANESTGNPTNGNERLEFLGDAILDAIVSVYLFNKFPEKEEGELTKLRAQIVCEKSLGHAGKISGLNEFLLLGKGEEAGGGRQRVSIIADTVEAIIGAVFLDGGLEKAKAVAEVLLSEVREEALSGHLAEDYKTTLQEWMQKYGKAEPFYKIIAENGPDHSKVFTAAACSGSDRIGIGSGTNKKEAEQAAARDALKNIKTRGSRCISNE